MKSKYPLKFVLFIFLAIINANAEAQNNLSDTNYLPTEISYLTRNLLPQLTQIQIFLVKQDWSQLKQKTLH